jgi:maltooligosyltrehalose trehalohydrolase
MTREAGGYYTALVAGVGHGDRYRFRVGDDLLADPASRFQPEGPFGPSQVVDPGRFHWQDDDWRGVALDGQVIYELHVGTFTPEGTWQGAAAKLPQLVEIGITVVEVMPVSEFPGRFGWGYDGVFPYAPTRLYGTPDDFRAFVARAHALGVAVILDVVYNHLGPDGCVFGRLASRYYTDRFDNEWGDALNFDAADAAPAREFWCANAGYWIDEFHLDGLRLDATQSIHDVSEEHILSAMSARARAAAGRRRVILVAENEPQDVRLVQPRDAGGYGLDGLWNDDFHHSAIVAVTGRREAYYSDHHGTPQELISAAKYGYLFQGQRYAWQQQRRGTPTTGLPSATFVNFIENHDQVANSADGARVRMRTSPGRYRAMTALMLLMPGTPMLFQGQEFGASTPFLYFADHRPELADAVQKGRAQFLSQFVSDASPEVQRVLAPPHAAETFERSKLDWRERDRHGQFRRLHRDLIALRRRDAAFASGAEPRVDGSVIAPEALALRFVAADPADERLLMVNLGSDLVRESIADPLVAPPPGCRWQLHWSSESPDYGGTGTPQIDGATGWRVPGHAAVVLRPEKNHGGDGAERH